MRHSNKKLDLTGQRFGKLTALAPAENIGGCTAWLCRCDCGQETVVITKRLRDGHRTSCGCDNENFGKPPNVAGRASLTYVEGTCVEMLQLDTVRRINTSGVTGVDWLTRKRRWRASICFKGVRRSLGTFENFDDAVEARKRAEAELYQPFLEKYQGSGAAG